ncbi:MAG TPA: ammonium transporter [Prosthecobacter sp.]|nr:ammonium transporter [Prosthecobacter sp.]
MSLPRLLPAMLLLAGAAFSPLASQTPSPENPRIEAKLDTIITKLDGVAAAVGADKTAPESPPPTDETGSAAQASVDLVWVILAGALVFLMQAGFGLLELGFSRAKNSINIVMKNFLDFSIAVVVFMFLGFGLMFGSSAGGWIGTDGFWLSNFPEDSPLWGFWFFQVVFAGTACTIVSGAMAERTKFVGYLVYAGFLSGVIYPLTGHWAWGSFGGAYGVGGTGGWLESLGFVDFAGSTVVHGCGGACALAGILVVGARHGRFAKDGSPRMIAGHNIPLAALGVFILWFGWFGFNAGSTLAASGGIGRIVVNTAVSPASGALAAMLSMWFVQGRPDVGITLNGALGGLVGITACCANISPASALAVGLVAGILTTVSTIGLERLRLDDAVGAVPVHLVNGWWGTLCVALFDQKGFDARQLGIQALGTFSITATSFILCLAVFKTVDLLVGLRATDEEQINGLDFSEHSANAYPDFQTTEQV